MATVLQPIAAIAAATGIPASALYAYGPYKAKLTYDYLATLPAARRGKLILVTAINPTTAGEGKTTTTIGLGDALRRSGRSTMICLREPSLGPCFGAKGGATGGGASRVAPADEINLGYRLALGRAPTVTESRAAGGFVSRQESSYTEAGRDPKEARRLALVDFCQVLFGLNEFIYIK